ncbi:MAG: hypothetical protein ACYS47_04680 [Planctomycetota bacterium]
MLVFLIMAVIGTVGFFYKAGREDHGQGWLWGGISLALWMVALFWLPLGFWGAMLLQLGLFAFMTGRNMWRDRHTLLRGPTAPNRRFERDPDEFLYE